MSFILKTSPIVINIKLTNLGRQLLSQGRLTFTKFALGDSEIDYSFNTKIGFDAFKANILRPKDGNPKFLSFIKRDDSDDSSIYTQLPSVVSNTNIITNTATERGFFAIDNSGNAVILTDQLHCKQSDMQILISEVTGGTILKIYQSPSYIANITEPVVGDYLLVKWANPLITGGTVTPNIDQNVPYIWYKIQAIVSGSLAGNNLIIEVDKPTPNFNGLGGSIASGAFVYPNNNNREVSGDSIQTYYGTPYATDYIDENVIAFLENCICPIQDVPVWNMTIVFTEEVAGVTTTSKNYSMYDSRGYGGFIRYIERITPDIKKIGIIHFTNASPSNHYGEGLFEDTPVLDLPTIMWHHETGSTIGLRLTTEFDVQILPDLETTYRNLVDRFGNVVGKVFNELKIFVIEDQELLFAMTYKANRNWTLPKPTVTLNGGFCDPCNMILISANTTPDNGSSNGSITINVDFTIGNILYSINSGLTYQSSNVFTGLTGGDYSISVVDTGVNNCIIEQVVNVPLNLTTTTTTTTTTSPIFVYEIQVYSCGDCNYIDIGYISTIIPLTVGQWYKLTDNNVGLIISQVFVPVSITHTIGSFTSFPNCINVDCIPPTTTTTPEPTTTTTTPEPTTTTTTPEPTTTAEPNVYTIEVYSCGTCNLIDFGFVDNSIPLTIGAYYSLTTGDVAYITGQSVNTPNYTIGSFTSYGSCGVAPCL